LDEGIDGGMKLSILIEGLVLACILSLELDTLISSKTCPRSTEASFLCVVFEAPLLPVPTIALSLSPQSDAALLPLPSSSSSLTALIDLKVNPKSPSCVPKKLPNQIMSVSPVTYALK
jgi:hypothetical protein